LAILRRSMMKVNLEKIENNIAYLNFEVGEERFEKAMEQAYKKEVKRFSVPGFRKGKAPRSLIERHYGPEVFYQSAAEIILPEAYDIGVKDYQLEPVDQPKFDIQQIEKGKKFLATAEVVVKPKVEIKEYKGLEVNKMVYNVTEEDVDKELKALQEKNARLVAVEDRAAEKGDIVVIDFEGFIDDKPFKGGKAENYPLELGSSNFIPGFEEQLIGCLPETEKEVKVTFPDDYKEKKIAGKEAVFKVKVKDLKRKDLLPLDDEFAKDVSEFETLEDLKDDIRKRLEQRAESFSDSSVKGEIVKRLSESVEIDIPGVMIDREIDKQIMDFAMSLRYQGIDIRSYLEMAKISPDDLRDRFRQKAIDNVKTSLILEQIAELENIQVSEEELDEEINKYADAYKTSPEEYRKKLNEENINGIKDAILTKKIFDFLIDNAKITEKKVENIEPQGETAETEEVDSHETKESEPNAEKFEEDQIKE
jgi:trigger factor